MRILITGGAGFIGSSLATMWRRMASHVSLFCMDNLMRRGSELTLTKLKSHQIHFIHGDIRCQEDFLKLPDYVDVIIDASADPSVTSGRENPRKLLETNLIGTLNILEYARKHARLLIFLSTSRVYSVEALRSIPLQSNSESRLESDFLIDEGFSTDGYRSLYGHSKLASEGLIQEYAHHFGVQAIINRLSVVSGAGQWGKGDQGVFSYWMVQHALNRSLTYKGFGGTGKQVRDILHPADLFQLIKLQVERDQKKPVELYNVGGGPRNSCSLYEFTKLCEKLTGNKTSIQKDSETDMDDIPYYVTNISKVKNELGWEPTYSVTEIAEDIYRWIGSVRDEWGDNSLPW